MKATELMIGDLVCYSKANNWVTKVEAVTNPGQTFISDVYGIKCYRTKDDPLYEKAPIDFFNVDILHPIPLTVEILKSNGFEKKGHRYGIYDDYFDFEMYEYNDGTWLVSYHCCEMSLPDEQVLIFHVHQLQHFMRHCAIDKVLNLNPET